MHTQTRRQFLRAAVGGPFLLSLSSSVPSAVFCSAADASRTTENDRVLVVVQLTGGNDGLNTVVPFTDDAYARSRPTLRLPASKLHKLTQQMGLHPNMGAIARLFNEGRLGIVQGVGSPGLSRDHERAMRFWQSAVPDEQNKDTGWLGRAADDLWGRSRPSAPAVFVGDIPRPFGVNAGVTVVPTLHRSGDAALPGVPIDPAPVPGADVASPLLKHVRRTFATAREHARRLEKVAGAASVTGSYPDTVLANDLKTVARLIRAEIGIRVFYTELGGGGIGGFDNHANQIGNHCALLGQLSEALAAFAGELASDGLLDRVLVLTFSEFGRTVAENGRRGTDHGSAGPMFLLGGRCRGGIYGEHPSLTDLEGDALKHHTDFRAVYATLLGDWLQLPAAAILGAEYPRLPLLVPS